jgi:hypothetical protein
MILCRNLKFRRCLLLTGHSKIIFCFSLVFLISTLLGRMTQPLLFSKTDHESYATEDILTQLTYPRLKSSN